MNWKRLVIFLILVASLFLFIPNENVECIWQEEIESLEFDGIVVAKYTDSTNHSIPVLKIRNFSDNQIDTVYLFGDESGVFSIVNKADTIFKYKSSSIFYRRSSDSIEYLGQVNFGCEPN